MIHDAIAKINKNFKINKLTKFINIKNKHKTFKHNLQVNYSNSKRIMFQEMNSLMIFKMK